MARSKRAMSTVIPRFNMERVLFDYTQGLYQPAARQYRKLAADAFAGARQLAEWKQRGYILEDAIERIGWRTAATGATTA